MEMVSVDEAKRIILDQTVRLPASSVPLVKACGLVLREAAISPTDVPAFAQSSMDGYAMRFEEAGRELVIQGVIPAGAQEQMTLQPGHAIRIFTGGPVPDGADTIVVQEKAIRTDGTVRFSEPPAHKGLFVRARGTELRKGEQVLTAGNQLTPVLLGLLAGSGIETVNITRPPSVTVIATGPELATPGTPLAFGQVYESNGLFLHAAMAAAGVTDQYKAQADDTLVAVKTALLTSLDKSDIVILTGGVSVGDFDFVRQAADETGVTCQFHRVKQKPGKPFYFGTHGRKLVFGLPGNPGSVVSCFYEYVLPALQKAMGREILESQVTALLAEDFVKVKGLTQFLKGFAVGSEVSFLEGQESFRLRSFAEANCLIRLEEDKIAYKKGESVRIRLLPR